MKKVNSYSVKRTLQIYHDQKPIYLSPSKLTLLGCYCGASEIKFKIIKQKVFYLSLFVSLIISLKSIICPYF